MSILTSDECESFILSIRELLAIEENTIIVNKCMCVCVCVCVPSPFNFGEVCKDDAKGDAENCSRLCFCNLRFL